MKRIAVWNTAFLGDAVLSLPLLQSLKAIFPEAELDFYVRAGFSPLFAAHPAITRVYEHDKRGQAKGLFALARCGRDLAERQYDLWISAHLSLRSSLLAAGSRAPMRIGYKEASLAALCYTHRVERRFGQMDEIDRLLRLLLPLTPDGPQSPWPELTLPRESKQAAEDFFAGLDGPALGLHPGSTWATKRWPEASFAEIGLRALHEGAHVLLFAGPGEEAIAASVREKLSQSLPEAARLRLHDLSGQLPLPLLAAYLGKLACYVTNDSGPMHLAWIQHTPVTAVFGPTTRSLGFFPRGPAAHVCETPLDCRPCGLHGPSACPKGHHRCMNDVPPDQVWEDVRLKLAGSPRSPEKK